MRTKQWGILGAVVITSFLIFLLFDHKKEVKSTSSASKKQTVVENADLKEKLIKEAFSKLPEAERDSAKQLIEESNYLALALGFEKVNQYDAAVLSYCIASKGLEEEKDLLFVGKKIVNSLSLLVYPEVKEQGTRVAKIIYERLVKKDPKLSDYQIGLAACYIEGIGDIMTGVTILKKVLEGEPNNINANFQLGRLGIVSGQFDKAISRLQVVVEQDPEDINALLYLSEAYLGLGKKQEAIKYLKQASVFTTNMEVKFKIENYIKELSN